MRRKLTRTVLIVLLVVSVTAKAHSQQQESDTRTEFWSEIDVFVPLNEKTRLFFIFTSNRAEETRKDRESTVGAHVDYNVNKRFVLRGGYRYTFSINDAEPFREHRIITEQTFRQNLPLALLLSDRNRQDWRFVMATTRFAIATG